MEATSMSFIRYRYKSEKDFQLFLCDGIDCSVGYLKQCLKGKSSKPATHRLKNRITFIITDASTNEEYRNNNDLIPRYTNVIVVRRPYETYEPLTPETVQYQHNSSNDFREGNLRFHCLSKALTSAASCENNSATATTELELIKNIQKEPYQTTKPVLHVCHYCKQSGHIKRHCPLLIKSFKTKTYQTIDSTHKSVINVDSSASILPSRPHPYLINNKNSVRYDVNNTNIKTLLSNKETSIDTHHFVPASHSSSFSSSNISFQQSPLNVTINRLPEDDDRKLSQIRSVQPLAYPSYKAFRYSPYQLPYDSVQQPLLSKTRADISYDNFVINSIMG